MTVREVAKILDAEIICEGNLDAEVKDACGCDLMSDVLAFVKEQAVLLTGLLNPQVIRTAEMMDMHCIIFVRGKIVTPIMVNLANQMGITILSTKLRLFTACGKLYENGLQGGSDDR